MRRQIPTSLSTDGFSGWEWIGQAKHPDAKWRWAVAPESKIAFETVPAKTFFSFLLGNTKEGFFADPMYGGNKNMVGWKMVGFPGARGDYMDWVDQPNVKYPYGPVSISGEKG